MVTRSENPAEEIKRLRRCINDLAAVLALPAIGSQDPTRIVRTLLDMLLNMLDLDFVYVNLKNTAGETPIEMIRVAPSANLPARPQEVGEALRRWLGPDSLRWAPQMGNPFGNGDISIVPSLLGLTGEIGVVIAGSSRPEFPGQAETLLLSVSVNQAAIGLQEARLLAEQKRVANELDQRVSQRTSELAAANESLRAAEEKNRLIIDSTLDAVITIDTRGTITSWNKQAEVVFGWSAGEAIGRQMAEMIIPIQYRSDHQRGLRHFLVTGDGPILRRRVEFTAIRRSGDEFPIELEVMPMRLGQDWQFSAFIHDITTSKLAATKLRESELNLRQLTETIPEMLWSATADGAIDYYNARVLDYSGFRAETIMGANWIKLLHAEDIEHATRMWTSCIATGAPYRIEVRMLHASEGKYRWCVSKALPLLDQQGHIIRWHGTIVDMHDWKQAQEELRDTQAELARTMRVMTAGELTASIAHEVNQPLSGIITNAGTCLRMLATDPPNIEGARETARRTLRDGNRASDVIARLRALFAKKGATTEPVDLNEATREVIALSSSELERNRVILRTEFADDLPLVSGDRIQLQQVIINLVLNASDAMSHVEDRPRQLLIRSTRDENEWVRLSVRDTGLGFEPQSADRLFEAFYTTKSSGMGIGLSVSRSIIENHRGRLWAESNQSAGATFSFAIPGESADRDRWTLEAVQS